MEEENNTKIESNAVAAQEEEIMSEAELEGTTINETVSSENQDLKENEKESDVVAVDGIGARIASEELQAEESIVESCIQSKMESSLQSDEDGNLDDDVADDSSESTVLESDAVMMVVQSKSNDIARGSVKLAITKGASVVKNNQDGPHSSRLSLDEEVAALLQAQEEELAAAEAIEESKSKRAVENVFVRACTKSSKAPVEESVDGADSTQALSSDTSSYSGDATTDEDIKPKSKSKNNSPESTSHKKGTQDAVFRFDSDYEDMYNKLTVEPKCKSYFPDLISPDIKTMFDKEVKLHSKIKAYHQCIRKMDSKTTVSDVVKNQVIMEGIAAMSTLVQTILFICQACDIGLFHNAARSEEKTLLDGIRKVCCKLLHVCCLCCHKWTVSHGYVSVAVVMNEGTEYAKEKRIKEKCLTTEEGRAAFAMYTVREMHQQVYDYDQSCLRFDLTEVFPELRSPIPRTPVLERGERPDDEIFERRMALREVMGMMTLFACLFRFGCKEAAPPKFMKSLVYTQLSDKGGLQEVFRFILHSLGDSVSLLCFGRVVVIEF
jgi:hypothetical protein